MPIHINTKVLFFRRLAQLQIFESSPYNSFIHYLLIWIQKEACASAGIETCEMIFKWLEIQQFPALGVFDSRHERYVPSSCSMCIQYYMICITYHIFHIWRALEIVELEKANKALHSDIAYKTLRLDDLNTALTDFT